ncbi:DUF86 domain-containing protein [Spirosoma sp. KUDC1026]|uniref:HepT-like ribonuclease domain-containing protein n=1 Tax=Spirosoma sp. KUDC1026 TaxID=2745947 RepID=UPI00159BD8F1|nr:HepT-like ribonuclease domain-containing protein [Spirosoma sp. KUDC1026]QKZ11996.1 hypothetical protein HU175_04875 [Spirosoma sp. KUDC1026]
MQHDLRKYLTDIKLHIDYIEDFLAGNEDFAQYEKNLIVQYAVERALGIIGEAVNQIRKLEPDIAITSIL